MSTSLSARTPDPRLFTPGPLNTSETVRAAANRDLGSRTAAARGLTRQLCEEIEAIAGLGPGFCAIPLQGSGTFALEAMLTSMLNGQDHLLLLENGVYSARMAEICRIHGIRHHVLKSAHTQGFDLATVAAWLQNQRSITHIAAVHFETGLGVRNDIAGLSTLAARHHCRLLLDCISSFGALPLQLAPGSLGALALSANKCLHGLPGLAFVVADEPALARRGQPRTLSLDLQAQWRGLRASQEWRFTPPLQSMCALAQALAEFLAQGGQPARYQRYAALAQALLHGMEQIGFKTLIAAPHRAPMILSFAPESRLPGGIAGFKAFLAQRGLEIYPCPHWSPDAFRIGLMGELCPQDIHTLLCACHDFISQRAPDLAAAHPHDASEHGSACHADNQP
jgi:2-aminoethylphosphonate-pyruvate transaminase